MRPHLKVYFVLVGVFLLGYSLIPLSQPLFPNDYSAIILDENQELLRVFTNRNEQWHFPPYVHQSIPDKLKQAVLLYEDQYFYFHPGINPLALVRAFWLNSRYHKVISGGSTITMQCARLMKPKQRTVLSKLLEICQALKIETLYSKETILLTYLNHAPYGSNIVGYQAAAYKYFKKPAKQLTWAEATTLAVLPNAPSMITPMVNRRRLIEKRNKLLKKLHAKGHITQATLAISMKEPAPSRAHVFPFVAPQFSRYLLKHHQHKRLETTINKKIQIQVSQIVSRQMNYLKQYGIHNASVLVSHTPTGTIKAYLGSNDYFDQTHQGQVDGVRAPRSSGSILKPFLVALAMDEGLLLPDTLIHDVPTHFKAFSPKNYNNEFNGLVSTKEALTHSLNVPAVRLLNSYGLHSFYMFLKTASVSTLFRHADHYGLPLILGGAEVTLWDMVRLYRGLGRQGNFSSLKLLKNEESKKSESLIHSASCYLTLEILKDLKRPGAEYYWSQYEQRSPLAWKTGTSYGHRDAWAIGVSPEWTIGVWVGNFSGQGSPDLSGAKSAGPILFEVFNMLPKTENLAWFEKPKTAFKSAMTCLETGFVASSACPHPKPTLIPKHNQLFRQCRYHKIYYINQAETNRLCSLCWQGQKTKKVQRLIYPPHIMQFMRDHGHQITALPIHNPDCPSVQNERVMDIIYPQENIRIWLPRGLQGHYQRVVAKVTHRDQARRLFWYMDQNYLGETEGKHEKALALDTGDHILEIVDDQGNRLSRRFQTAVRGEEK